MRNDSCSKPIGPEINQPTMILKKQLKDLLIKNDTTVAQLARATKISPKTIYQWLNGQSPRNLNHIKRIADHFQVSVDFLAFGVSRPESGHDQPLSEQFWAGTYEVFLRPIEKNKK